MTAVPTVSRSNEMGVRKKGRVKFTFNDRQFVWWIDNDTFLRIASDDKRFVVANLLIDRLDLLAVHGPDFPGITSSVLRPVWLVMPDFDCGANFGRRVALILNWCLNGSSHPQFAGQLPQYAGGG